MKRFETTWKTKDGLNIFSQGWQPEGRNEKAVMCLVHGAGEHTSRYAHVAEAFTSEGYALMGADLRGHGRSEGIRGHTPSVESYMDDIDLLLGQVQTRFPGLPVILYGHSLGGVLVIYYGLKRKFDLKGVISTSPSLHTEIEKQAAKVMAAKALGALIPGVTLPSGLDAGAISRDAAVVAAYKNDPLVHDKLSLGFGRTMLGASRYILEHAGEFPYPLLLLHGKADMIAFPSSSIEVEGMLKGKATLVLWDDAYHELHNEPQKAEVFKTMTIWMDARIKP